MNDLLSKKQMPGNDPAFPVQVGATQMQGLSKRDFMAVEFAKSALSRLPVTQVPGEDICKLVVGQALMLADHMVEVLYPPRANVSAVVSSGHIQESSSCGHDGEWIMEKGKALCVKCKQLVPKDIIISRLR